MPIQSQFRVRLNILHSRGL